MKNFIKKKSLFGFILLLLAIGVTNAQMGIGTDEPHASALLDITATDKGLLIPRVTITDLTSNTTPVAGPMESLLVYNETSKAEVTNSAGAVTTAGIAKGYYYWDSAWIPISNPAAIGKDVTSTDGSITGVADGAALVAMDLQVKVDDATIKINTGLPENPQPSDIVNTAEKGKLYVNLKAGGGLIKDSTGALLVSIGGGTEGGAEGGAAGTATGENTNNKGAGENVTSVNSSIDITNGFGAAFTKMKLDVKVDDATIKINTGLAADASPGTTPSAEKGELYVSSVPPVIIGDAIAGAGLTRDIATGILSVDITGSGEGENAVKGIGKNLTSTDGSIFSTTTTTTTDANGTTTTTTTANDSLQSGVSAVLKELNLQVKVDNETIKINNGLAADASPSTTPSAEKGELYVNLKVGGGLVKDSTGAISVDISGTGTGTGTDTGTGIGKKGKSSDGSITGFTDANKAFLEELDLKVNVDGTTIEIDSTNGIQIKALGVTTAKIADSTVTTAKINNGAVTKDKILDGAVMPLKIHGDIAGAGLTRDDATGVLSVNIGGGDGILGDGTGSDGDNKGAGKDVTSDGSITVTNGSGAAFTEMDLQVKVDNATIKINTGLPENPQPSDIVNTAEKGKLYVDAPYYSATANENLTIRKWIGGENIYETVETVTTTTSSTKLEINKITGLTQVLNIRIIANAASGGANANAGGVHHSGKYTTGSFNDTITVGSGKMTSVLPAGKYYVIVEYLK